MDVNQDFDGRVAVVTGASGGMGAEIASRLASLGTKVYGVDIASPVVPTESVHSIECDISRPDEVRRAASTIQAQAGKVDFLVNAAGLVSTVRPAETITDDEWAALMGVNASGAFYWMREVLGGMKSRKFGKVVNVSSNAGRTHGAFSGAHYAASKAAILGLTRQIAYEAGPDNVYVNAIAPGLVRTPMLDGSVNTDRVDAFAGQTPLRRIGTVQDIAHLVIFLLSSQSDYITGATIDINGGVLIM